jgi:hypothetical protein
MPKGMAMAKAKKRAAARTKSSKHGKATVKSASKKTAKRAMRKQAKPKPRRPRQACHQTGGRGDHRRGHGDPGLCGLRECAGTCGHVDIGEQKAA